MQVNLSDKIPKQLLNPSSGYLQGYSHTLNPYAGCAFACSYCYVRQMPIALFRKQPWGTWIDVKREAASLLEKELTKAKLRGPVTIFMSSSTDPYQPIEYREQVTRTLLEVMLRLQPDFLFVQTRSPLVVRDIDLFQQFKQNIRISVTVETDLENVRKVFSPAAPPIQARLHALKKLAAAGIPTQAAVSPVLPCSDDFSRKLAEVVNRVCLDDFFMGDGRNGKRTEKLGIQALMQEHHWGDWYSREAYLRVIEQLKQHFSEDCIKISQQGFLP